MTNKQTMPKVVREYMEASRKLRKELKDPEKAKAFLLEAGLAEKCGSAPYGIRLAKRYR